MPRTARPSRPPLRPPRPESVGSRGGCSWRPRPCTPARLQLRLRSSSREAEGRRCDSPPRPLPASVSPRVRRRRQRLPSARLPLDSATARRAPLPSLPRRLPCSGRRHRPPTSTHTHTHTHTHARTHTHTRTHTAAPQAASPGWAAGWDAGGQAEARVGFAGAVDTPIFLGAAARLIPVVLPTPSPLPSFQPGF